MLNREIKVHEVNQCLSKVYQELLAKYGKVSHPDFEKELENLTGIRYKQLKNYKNHPLPGRAISPNAKIVKFVKTQRRERFKRKILPTVMVTLAVLVSVAIYTFFVSQRLHPISPNENLGTTPTANPISLKEATKSLSGIKFSIPGTIFSIGLGKGHFQIDKMNCRTVQANNDTLHACAYSAPYGSGRIELNITYLGSSIINYTLQSSDHKTNEVLLKQLEINVRDKFQRQTSVKSRTQSAEFAEMLNESYVSGDSESLSMTLWTFHHGHEVRSRLEISQH